jgi:GNAT superfamily N-acetyltransferase
MFYFGESVLLSDYRGQGVGHRFFDERESFAREQGFAWAAFCAVVRPLDHPSRPAGYVPHDAFWAKRGFVCHPDLKVAFSWKDIGAAQETEKPMVFWLKQLATRAG